MGFSLSLQRVAFAYGDHRILRDVSLVCRAGTVAAISGAAGTGKSTLFKIAAGLLEPDNGIVEIDRKIFWNLPSHEQSDVRRSMGYFFQEPALIANMTIVQNLSLPLRYYRTSSDADISHCIERGMAEFNLVPYKNLLPAALSRGVRRRVSFMRATLADAHMYFWDEPTESTGKDLVEKIVSTLRTAKDRGVSSLVFSHDEDFCRRIADECFVLVDGVLVKQ